MTETVLGNAKSQGEKGGTPKFIFQVIPDKHGRVGWLDGRKGPKFVGRTDERDLLGPDIAVDESGDPVFHS